MSYFDTTVFNRIAQQQKETNDLLRELIKILQEQEPKGRYRHLPVQRDQTPPYVPPVQRDQTPPYVPPVFYQPTPQPQWPKVPNITLAVAPAV